MKNAVVLSLFIAMCLSGFSQDIHQRNSSSGNVLSTIDTFDYQPAANVYVEYSFFLKRIPTGEYNYEELNDFIKNRFVKDATIDVKATDTILKRTPRRYFDDLVSLYIGSEATYSKASEIEVSQTLKPYTEKDADGTQTVVIEILQREKNVIVNSNAAELKTENRKMKIKLVISTVSKTAKIKAVTLEDFQTSYQN